MSKPNKKQRHKARREAKRKEMRRRESVSPIKRLADASGEIECWMSEGFGQFGQLQIFCCKRGAGLSGVACFLIDRGVVGLKDAWTKMRVDREEFAFMVERSQSHGIAMKPAKLMEARRWIAAGVRWAHDNGMRLPKDWVKVASIIGGVGDWANADVSEFEMEFAGRPEDLRQRLIGQPFEEFIRRTDVQFIFNESAPMMDLDTGEYEDDDEDPDSYSEFESIPEDEMRSMGEGLTPRAAELSLATSRWLSARGERNSSELLAAWQSVLVATRMAVAAAPDADSRELSDLFENFLDEISDGVELKLRAEYNWALDMVIEHLTADPDLIERTANSERGVDKFVDVSAVSSSPVS